MGITQFYKRTTQPFTKNCWINKDDASFDYLYNNISLFNYFLVANGNQLVETKLKAAYFIVLLKKEYQL